MKAIEIESLKKYYRSDFFLKRNLAIENLSFSVGEGKITGFLGANGAGKSTTIKCILGLLIADEGKITFFGDKQLSANVKKKIGFLPERPFFYEYLDGVEFLQFYAQLSGIKQDKFLKQRIEELLKLVGLSFAKEKKLREYSKGMLQRIGIAQAIVHDPDLVILDEPMSGLDPDGRYEVAEIIRKIAAQGKSVFFSSHLLHDVEKLCEDLIILRKGELMYEGGVAHLLEDISEDFQINYLLRGEKQLLKVSGLMKLQEEIDGVRGLGGSILTIDQSRRSLEDAYVKINKLETKGVL